MKTHKLITTLIFLLSFYAAEAQIENVMKGCKSYLPAPYISDGQQYRAMLANNEETAEFRSTFYGGSTYRIVLCSSVSQKNVQFSIFDSKRKLIFSNTKFRNTPYWDFQFESTMECVIEAKFDEKTNTSGFVVMLIGFKQ